MINRYGRDPFRLSKANVNSFIAAAGILLTKGSPLKEIFDDVLHGLKSGGIVDHITESYYWYWHPDPPDESTEPIGLDHLTFPLLFLCAGLILALASFIIEVGKCRVVSKKLHHI